MIPFEAARDLERFLGDPCDAAASISFDRQITEDERDAFPEPSVDHLDTWGLHRYYVPHWIDGGRLRRFDEFLYLLRVVSRRDLTVAIAHAKTFLGSAPVWIAGTPEIQSRCASLVLRGDAVALALTEVESGSDIVASDCRLTGLADTRFRLSGTKWLINNATRSAAMTVYANLADVQGSRAGTLVWIEKDRIARTAWRSLAKEPTHGIRGADISGIVFEAAEVEASDIIGATGAGLEITLKSLQLSRTLCCSLSTGAGDTALRILFGFMRDRVIGGKPLLSHPYHRSLLLDAFALQLAGECLSLAASRLLHVSPGEMSLVSSIAKYFVPSMVETLFESAQNLMGARAYLRAGAFAAFQKAKRDHRLVSLFDGSSVVNLQAIVLQLKALARQSVDRVPARDESEPLQRRVRAAFDMAESLPDIDFSRLALSSRGLDTLTRYLLHVVEPGLTDMGIDGSIESRVRRLIRLLRKVLSEAAGDSSPPGADSPESFDAAKTYCALYAAGCAFGIWYFNKDNVDLRLDSAFRQGAWLARLLDLLLDNPDRDATPGDVFPWLDRLIADGQALSVVTLPCPFSVQRMSA